ncbi:MAG: hypothetical protein P8P16_12975 [Amylibacter sp.]|nr:hypothetical protein [Amylibacter sp.]
MADGVLMGIKTEHPLHGRRKRSNMLLGLVLLCFVALVFAITVAKMMNGQSMEAFDHTVRYSIDTALQDVLKEDAESTDVEVNK